MLMVQATVHSSRWPLTTTLKQDWDKKVSFKVQLQY